MAWVKSEFAKNALLTSGVLDYATDYDGTTYDSANKATAVTALEQFAYSSVGFFTDLAINHTQENEKIITTDFCGAGELDRTVELVPTVTFTWQEVNDIDIFASFLWLTVENINWTSTSITWEALWTWAAKWDIKFLANKNWDNTVVSSIIINADATSLVADTDYTINVDDGTLGKKGYTYITFLTVQTGVLTADYSYTPSVAKITWYTRDTVSLPSQALRFTTCADNTGKSDVYYLVAAKVSDAIAMNFVNRTTTDFKWATVTFTVVRGWNYFQDKKSL